jgi:hypothetical protein
MSPGGFHTNRWSGERGTFIVRLIGRRLIGLFMANSDEQNDDSEPR